MNYGSFRPASAHEPEPKLRESSESFIVAGVSTPRQDDIVSRYRTVRAIREQQVRNFQGVST